MTTGGRVRELRKEQHITQGEMSAKSGISKSMISLVELDMRKPGRVTLEAMADFFNVDVDYLLMRSDVKNSASETPEISEPRREYLKRRIDRASAEELRWLERCVRLFDAEKADE